MNITLITGATSGIGESLAQRLAERKHNLLLVARNEQKLRQLCRHLSGKNGIVAEYIATDLSEPGAAEQVFEESLKRGLVVNLLVNNAGVGSSGEFAKDDLHGDLKMLQLNNDSLVTLCRLFLPEMIGSRNGSIVNVGSLASFFPSPYMAVYAASKMFVRSFTQALTEEYKPYGVHVMLFCPGLTTTNFMNTTANDNDWGKIHIHEKLIEKAKEKLAGTELSVSEIAYHFGFEFPQSFSKLFKSKTRQTPLEYRQSVN